MAEKGAEFHRRSFKGLWIPREIWDISADDMSVTEKAFFGEIFALDGEIGCIASNEYLADFFGVSDRQIRNYIKKLVDLGLINVQINKSTDRRTIRCAGRYRHVPRAEIEKLSHLREQLSKKMSGVDN